MNNQAEEYRLKGWLPRRLRCLANECDDRSMYVSNSPNSKFNRTYTAAFWALNQAADRIEQLEAELSAETRE
jgi:hypothetical protein